MENKSSFGIIGVLILVVIVFLVIKYAWWLLLIGGALIIVFIIFLIMSSKKSKGEGSSNELEGQIRDALSSIRKQKFKSENKINNIKLWANQAINTSYAGVLGGKYTLNDMYKNYDGIKNEFGTKLTPAEVDKTDQIVVGYLNLLETEKQKIEMLSKLQNEHESLREKLKKAKVQERSNKQLDKHVNRINQSQFETSGEETIIKADYTLEDLKNEVAMKQEYVKQLEELDLQYGNNIDNNQISQYSNQLKSLMGNMK